MDKQDGRRFNKPKVDSFAKARSKTSKIRSILQGASNGRRARPITLASLEKK